MPIAMDPQQTIKLVLERHFEKLAPPTFLYKPLTARQWRTVAGLNDRIGELDNPNAMIDGMVECVRLGLVGWENMVEMDTGDPVAFAPDRLEDIVTMPDLQELIAQRTTYFNFEDKKKLSSPSDSETATSVENVEE